VISTAQAATTATAAQIRQLTEALEQAHEANNRLADANRQLTLDNAMLQKAPVRALRARQ